MRTLSIRLIPLLLVLLFTSVSQASAQGVSAYFGVGSANNSAATSAGCPSQQILDNVTGVCEPAPTMGGVFGVFGADFMIKSHLGFNAEDTFRFAQENYLPTVGINARPSFYDFNAVYQPTSGDARIVPVIEGGIGGAKVSFYVNQSSCVSAAVCTNYSQEFASSNHFQVHGAVGVKLYVKSDVFIKPQIDFHWVDNLNQLYGRNIVPVYTVSIGYTFGRH
ncbi:MAG: hypothetical protein ABSA96_17505 [Candidatus Acidiferrales bacterium]